MIGLKTKISTPLLEESVDFYTRHFGMKVLETWDEPDDRGVILGFSTPEAEAFLEIYYAEELGNYDAISLQFRVDSAKAFAEGIRGKVEFRGPTPRPWGSLYVYLTDLRASKSWSTKEVYDQGIYTAAVLSLGYAAQFTREALAAGGLGAFHSEIIRLT